MASLMERTVQSMLATMPLRRPRQGTMPDAEDGDAVGAVDLGHDGAHLRGADVEADDDLALRSCSAHLVSAIACPQRGGQVSKGRPQRMRTTTRSGRVSLSSMMASAFAPRLVELGDDARGLIELAPEGRRAQDELHGAAADDEREDPVRLDVHLLERRALRQRPFARTPRRGRSRAGWCASFPRGRRLSISGAKPGHERQVDPRGRRPRAS